MAETKSFLAVQGWRYSERAKKIGPSFWPALLAVFIVFVDQTKQAYRYIFPARVANQKTGPFILPAARGASHVIEDKRSEVAGCGFESNW